MKITVKNPSNQTVEIEIDVNTAIVFEPHEVKVIDSRYAELMRSPLVVVGDK